MRALLDPALSDKELDANAHTVGGYFARLLTAHSVNPRVDTSAAAIHPCSLEFNSVLPHERADDCAGGQMRHQRHTPCNEGCLVDGVCRFLKRGDWSLRDTAQVFWARRAVQMNSGFNVLCR